MEANKWEMKVRTDDDSFVCEITDGKISICVNDDGEEEDMQEIVDALNKAEVSFYSNNKLELDQHIEIMQLQDEVRQWKAKYDELKADYEQYVKDFDHMFAEHATLKAKAEGYERNLRDIASGKVLPALIAQQALVRYNSSTTSKEVEK